MTTCVSRPFRFGLLKEWRVGGSNEDRWAPNLDPAGHDDVDASFELCRDRWVYGIARTGGAHGLALEVFIDGGDQIWPVTINPSNATAERDARGEPNAHCGTTLSIPYTINGRRVYWTFYASRVRLDADSVRWLVDHGAARLGEVDLSLPEAMVTPGDGVATVRITDPLTVAAGLHARYVGRRNALLGYTTTFRGQPRAQRRATERRLQTKLLATMIAGVIDSDPDDDLDLRDDFSGGWVRPSAENEMRAFLRDYDAQVERKVRLTARAGAMLCHWLEGELMTHAEVAHRNTVDERASFLEAWVGATTRLNECRPGESYLSGLIEDDDHFLHTYVLREDTAPEDVFAVGRKAAGAIAEMWKELAPIWIKLRGQDQIRVFVASLEYISRETSIFAVVERNRWVTMHIEERIVRHRISFTTVEFRPGMARPKMERWLGRAAGVSDLLGHLMIGVEIVNLGLSIRSLAAAEPGMDSWRALLGTIGSLCDTVLAFQILTRMSEKALAYIGIVSAALDALDAAWNANEMAGRNDYTAMVGYGVVGIGSVITGVGCIMMATGAGASATIAGIPAGVVIGIVGAVVTAVGWIIAVFSRDSALELFVQHCLWGEDYGDGATSMSDTPSWALEPFPRWRDNLALQLRVLINILAAFTLNANGYTRVTVYTGYIKNTSRFVFRFHAQYNLGIEHDPELVVHCGDGRVEQISGDPVAATRVRFRTSSQGRNYFDLDCSPAPGQPKFARAVEHQYCAVETRLDLEGDGESFIPADREWMSYRIHAVGTVLSGPASSCGS